MRTVESRIREPRHTLISKRERSPALTCTSRFGNLPPNPPDDPDSNDNNFNNWENDKNNDPDSKLFKLKYLIAIIPAAYTVSTLATAISVINTYLEAVNGTSDLSVSAQKFFLTIGLYGGCVIGLSTFKSRSSNNENFNL